MTSVINMNKAAKLIQEAREARERRQAERKFWWDERQERLAKELSGIDQALKD